MVSMMLLYIWILAALATFFLIRRFLVVMLKFILHPSGSLYDLASRYILLPYLLRRGRLWGPMTRLRFIMHIIHFAATIPFNIIGVTSFDIARSRAGSLAIVHLACLALFPQLSTAALVFNLSLKIYRGIHIAFGIMGVVQSLLHVSLALRTAAFDLRLTFQRYGLSAIIGASFLSLAMLPWIRHRIYEVCIKLHIILGISTIVLIWMHLKNRFDLDGYILIGSTGLLILNMAAQLLFLIYRNRKGLTNGERTALNGATRLTFKPTRPWKVLAGQYLYLKIPSVSRFSFAESHPFNIMWWEENDEDQRAISITVIAKAESGFSRRLQALSKNTTFQVIIDGPYGTPKNMDLYDSFIFVSTGIGITSQLPYLKQLIARQDQGFRLRRICLIWEVEEKAHNEWICDHVNELLDMDRTELVFRWAFFINSKPTDDDIKTLELDKEYNNGRRGKQYYGKPDLKDIVNKELELCHRRLLLTVSADHKTRDECRDIAIGQKRRIDLFETEFQPFEKSERSRVAVNRSVYTV